MQTSSSRGSGRAARPRAPRRPSRSGRAPPSPRRRRRPNACAGRPGSPSLVVARSKDDVRPPRRSRSGPAASGGCRRRRNANIAIRGRRPTARPWDLDVAMTPRGTSHKSMSNPRIAFSEEDMSTVPILSHGLGQDRVPVVGDRLRRQSFRDSVRQCGGVLFYHDRGSG